MGSIIFPRLRKRLDQDMNQQRTTRAWLPPERMGQPATSNSASTCLVWAEPAFDYDGFWVRGASAAVRYLAVEVRRCPGAIVESISRGVDGASPRP